VLIIVANFRLEFDMPTPHSSVMCAFR